MEKALINFGLFLILIYFARITRHGLHILQLENYYISRYAKWMKRCINKVLNIKNIILTQTLKLMAIQNLHGIYLMNIYLEVQQNLA